MAYFDNINNTIFENFPANAQCVLELGCGAGALAAALRSKHKTIDKYIGIEIDSHQAGISEQYTTSTLVKNLNNIPNWESDSEISYTIPSSSFDVVIMGDILEHLYHPLSTLQQAVSRLKKGGIAIACIPNVQHWSVFYNLVKGYWPQDDGGLFDRTHIRWFTLDNMVHLFQQANLEIQEIMPRVFEAEKGLSVMEDLEALARNLGVDPDVLIARGQALQFVLTGKRL